MLVMHMLQVIRNYHGHLSGVYSLALHPTLDILMTGGRDSGAQPVLVTGAEFLSCSSRRRPGCAGRWQPSHVGDAACSGWSQGSLN